NGVLSVEDTLSKSVAMLPNPTTGALTIVSPQAAIQQIEVYDIMGRKVSSLAVDNATSQQIDLSSLKTSVYFVAVKTDQGTLTKKVIKK
ncbi:MAG: T9SS type A sorting domain-containing protein, partial [Flavobacteriaceae bacterium]|nr:T9SS type A sorting domain-containing protein [Flavobacteriaceae bacterium]